MTATSCLARAAARGWICLGLVLALWLCLPGAATAAIAGLPQPPVGLPGDLFWVDTGNDNISDNVLNTDDFRTGTVDAGWLGGHWALGANASVLTDRAAQSRQDQLTNTLGWSQSGADGSYISAGAGLRAWGDFGGQTVQNRIHEASGYHTLDFTYDDTARLDPLGYLCGRYVWLVDTPGAASWLIVPGRWGLMYSGAGLATTNGDVEGELELDALCAGRNGSTYLGVRLHGEDGSIPGPTAHVVADHERGLWVMAGSSLQTGERLGLFADVGFDPHTRAGFGRLGLDIHDRPAGEPGTTHEVEADIGFYSGSVIGVQYRWQPVHQADFEAPWMHRWIRSEVLLDYRFGGIPHFDWADMKGESDQLLVGHAVTVTPPAVSGLRIEPYGYGAVGLRVEHMVASGPDPEFPDQEALRGVVQFGCGIRLCTDFIHSHPAWSGIDAFHVGGGYDRWFPWSEATASAGPVTEAYQRPGSSLGAYLGYTVDW